MTPSHHRAMGSIWSVDYGAVVYTADPREEAPGAHRAVASAKPIKSVDDGSSANLESMRAPFEKRHSENLFLKANSFFSQNR
jgi:hypothetical protein